MRYMMLIYSKETDAPPAELERIIAGHAAVMEESAKKGVLLGVERLKPAATATTVRHKDGAVMLSDGPFAETKEQLAGFYILECANLDEAIEWAKKIPTECRGEGGCIEIRPVDDLPLP
jgi:hypothetical protein